MARNNKGDKYWKGKGKLWIDGVEYGEVYKVKIEKTNEYEEVDDPNGHGKIQVWVGFSLEGTITMRKKGNEDILKELSTEKKGFEFDVIAKEENNETLMFESKLYKDVTVEKFPLTDYENKKITEIELSVKARDYEVLV